MKRRKLKKFVLPALYLTVTISLFAIVVILGSNFEFEQDDYDYGINALTHIVETVNAVDDYKTEEITSPIEEGKAEVSIHYYDSNSSEETQESSLIYYENTYMPNTGILYTSDEQFEVLTVFPGKVIDILEDEFFTKVVVVEHNKNLRTYYYGLNDIEVEVGNEITNGTVLGTSQSNAIMNTKKSFLLEVYFNNKLINPEKFIGTKITDYE